MEKSYKEYLQHITTFVFDVDGVFTDGTIHIDSQGELRRTMSVKDGFALKTAVDQGYKVCIISGGKNEGVRLRFKGLGVTHIYLGADQKTKAFNEFTALHGIQYKNVLYMGDDLPDIPVMELVGLPTCPQDAVAEVQQLARYVSHKKGGKGAVRDVIEQVLKVQGKWKTEFIARLD